MSTSLQGLPKSAANKKTFALMTVVIKVILGEVTRLTIAQPTFVIAVKLIASVANLSLICDWWRFAPIIGRRVSSRSFSTEWRENGHITRQRYDKIFYRMFLPRTRNTPNAECHLNYDPSLTTSLCRHAGQTSEPWANFFAHSETKFSCQLPQPGIFTARVFLLPCVKTQPGVNSLTLAWHSREIREASSSASLMGFFYPVVSLCLINELSFPFHTSARIHVIGTYIPFAKLNVITSHVSNLTDIFNAL